MSNQPTGTPRIILPEGLTWEQVHLAVKIIQNWEIAGSSDAVELVVGLYKLFKQGSEAADPWNEPPGGWAGDSRGRSQRVRHALGFSASKAQSLSGDQSHFDKPCRGVDFFFAQRRLHRITARDERRTDQLRL